jgi:hypothetical protein
MPLRDDARSLNKRRVPVLANGRVALRIGSTATAGWIVLYQGPEAALRRPVSNQLQAARIAHEWFRWVSGDTEDLRMPEPSRRRIHDRRKVCRGGRCTTDFDES